MRVKIFIVTFWSERHAYHRVHFPNENPTWRHNWICATRFDNGWDTTVSIEWAYHVTTSFLSSKNVRKHSLLYTGRSTPGLCWSALDTDRCCWQSQVPNRYQTIDTHVYSKQQFIARWKKSILKTLNNNICCHFRNTFWNSQSQSLLRTVH